MKIVDIIMTLETTECTIEEYMVCFSELIKTRAVWSLQGSYGRTAKNLISQGLISAKGRVNWEAVDERIMNA